MSRPQKASFPFLLIAALGLTALGLSQGFQPTWIASVLGAAFSIAGAVSYVQFANRFRDALANSRRPYGRTGHAVVFLITVAAAFVGGSRGAGVLWTLAAGTPVERHIVVAGAEWHEGGRRSTKRNCYKVEIEGERWREWLARRPCLDQRPAKGSILVLTGRESALGSLFPADAVRKVQAPLIELTR